MSQDSPPSPRDEIEARITALLLGELSAEEERTLRATLTQDATLRKLHDRLAHAIGLVSEAAGSLDEKATPPASLLRLSGERREKLLESFKMIRAKEPPKYPRVNWHELAALAAMFVALLSVATWVASTRRISRQSLEAPQAMLMKRVSESDRTRSRGFAASLGETMPARDLEPTPLQGGGVAGNPPSQPPTPPALEVGRGVLKNPDGEADVSGLTPPSVRFSQKPGALAGPQLRRLNEAEDKREVAQKNDKLAMDAKSELGLPRDGAGVLGRGSEIALRDLSRLATAPGPRPEEVASAAGTLNDVFYTAPKDGDTLGVQAESLAESKADFAGRAGGKDRVIVESFFAKSPANLSAGAALAFAPPTAQTELTAGGVNQPSPAAAGSFGLSVETKAGQGGGGLDPLSGSSALGDRSAVGPVFGDGSGAVQALGSLELRQNRVAIALPQAQMRGLGGAAIREPQLQTGPVTAYEIRPTSEPARVAKLAEVSDEAAKASSSPLDRVEEELVRQKKELDPAQTDGNLPKAAVPPSMSQPEVSAAENAFSTFSLNVTDVSFKLAAASLEKGQMPDATTVRSEEFINAFDYHDPEPQGGAPIAFAWERARDPFTHDRDLLRFSVKTGASGRQAGRPLNIVLLLDNSGSMERADRVRIIQECLRVLAGQLQPEDRVSVVAFARTARLWVDGLPGSQASELPQRVGGLTPQGGTNLEEAMNLAYQTAQRHFLANGVNRVVLLTDGAANLGDVEPESLKKKVEAHRRQGIAMDCFGIGWDGLNDELLEALSRNGDGRYGFVNSPEAAQSEFAGQLAGALKVAASDVKVQVEWNPRRVTAYRQIGYAKHQLRKEQFRDNTVDAAEIGAAEAGNALYVVQVNPRGEGPIATVRVRFKVPNTSDYREHEWPVPYEGAAKSLEQSRPSMRLATTASAFSEWLVSSPYAAEVTPDRLLGYLSGVPETCPADPRPKKLEWMIRQARSVSGK